jgi:hypothetical protein
LTTTKPADYYVERRKRRREKKRRKRTHQKEKSKEKLRKRKQFFGKWKTMLKKYIPCQDCGEHYATEKMTFDHVRGKKKYTMGNNDISTYKSFLREVEKCDIVCRWCHDAREHLRGTQGFQKLGDPISRERVKWLKAKQLKAMEGANQESSK